MKKIYVKKQIKKVTLEGAVNEFINSLVHSDKRWTTIKTYLVAINQFISLVGTTEIDIRDITECQIQAFIDLLYKSGNSSRTVKNKIYIIHSLFKFTVQKCWRAYNPCKIEKIKIIKKVNIKPISYSGLRLQRKILILSINNEILHVKKLKTKELIIILK